MSWTNASWMLRQPTPSPSQSRGGGVGLGLLSGLFGVGSDILNRHYRRKEERGRRKYEQARELDRRAYDQEMWSKVNKYNHPLAQMQRLKEAGLNPNLIYGSSPGSAVGNAQSIASGKQLQAEAPQYQFSNPMTPFMDTRVKQAQTNNLKTQSNLNTANAIKSIAQSGLAKSQTNQINRLLGGQFEIQKEEVKQAKIGTFLKTLEKTGKDKYYLAEMAAITNKAIAEGESAQAQVALSRLNERLAKKGIRPTDPLYMRLMGLIFGVDFSKDIPQEKIEQLETWFNNPLNRIQ